MAGPLAKKTIVLGVCGSVAAYKACDLASRLREAGASVLTAMTKSAQELVRPASFEAVTGNSVLTEMFSTIHTPEIEHIAVAQKADLFLIAPATANMLAKAAHGIGDDWLSTTLLATRAPVLYAPAMNTMMYTHPATQANMAVLRGRGAFFIGPDSGRLACGTEGPGRLADNASILDAVSMALYSEKDFAGKRVLITSGPNHEPLDPVRFLGNRSSGKMGRALALEALCRGAEVCVVSGPAAVAPPRGAQVIQAETARQMHEAVMDRVAQYDYFIAAAAVADFRLDAPSPDKIKRTDQGLTLTLTPNPDIVAAVAAHKCPHQQVVGFAAETGDVPANGEEKMRRKGLDMLVANTVGGSECAVGADQGNAWILRPGHAPQALGMTPKSELARRVFDILAAPR